MIGTVTLRDTSLELEGQPFEEGKKSEKPLGRGSENLKGGAFSRIKGVTGPPAMPVPRVTALRFPRSVTPVLETAARAHAGGI